MVYLRSYWVAIVRPIGAGRIPRVQAGSSQERFRIDVDRPRGIEAAIEDGDRIFAAKDDVPAPAVRSPCDIGRSRSDDRDRKAAVRRATAKFIGHRDGGSFGVIAIDQADGQLDKPP